MCLTPTLPLRSARQTERDAVQIGTLAEEFAAYLRSLGDQADFSFNAEAYLRDGFGSKPAFAGIVAETQDTILGYLLYHQATTRTGAYACSTCSICMSAKIPVDRESGVHS